jgi:DNA-binding transcriptional MerR regulator
MKHWTLSEVGRHLGVQTYRIIYSHYKGAVPETARFCGRRAYGEDDIDRLARYFKIENPQKKARVQV